MKKDIKSIFKNLAFWAISFIVMMSIFSWVNTGKNNVTQKSFSYSKFINMIDDKKIESVIFDSNRHILARTVDGRKFELDVPFYDKDLVSKLLENKVELIGKGQKEKGIIAKLLLSWGPFLIIMGIYIYFIRQQTGGGKNNPFSFGKSKAKLLGGNKVKETFKDVAGCDEAKEEVSELVDFLKDPKKFQKLGGKIPRGILLIGPPGSGKTLLAKAVSGEAKVPFFSISGSDFVEMFVGVGAARVRDMFKNAKEKSPCIIFIDELDAVGRHRGAGLGGGHDEREQTLNQLLVEMDGFEGNEGVIILAATNRPDVLDPALLRPGRFDREIIVQLPDVLGRKAILDVHMRNILVDNDIDSMQIARGTPGFSGADLANLINEAALIAASLNKKKVSMEELEKAKDKIMMGKERRSMVISEEEKKLIAYHEAGHTIVGRLIPEHDPVYKVSIIPRGLALGVTMFLPENDRYIISKERLQSKIAGMFGGRAAELIIFGEDRITTGAANDIQQATELARKMVTKWGLSKKIGPLLYDEESNEIFLGQTLASKRKELSEQLKKDIDLEIRKIVDYNFERAKNILQDNIKILHLMANSLIENETIDNNTITILMEGATPFKKKTRSLKKDNSTN